MLVAPQSGAGEELVREVLVADEEVSLLCLGATLPTSTYSTMTDTQLTVQCEGNVTCTALNMQPGATIVSPILLSLSGVAGQIWALYYLYTTTRPQHSRTVFFVLLSTLIWTDLVGKVITTTPALVAYAHGHWVGGVPLCNFHGFSMMLISLVTHLLVSTMAVERFIGIRHGYFYNKNITTSRTKMLLLGIWLFSVLFCAMPLFGVGQYALQYPGSWCFVNIHVCSETPLHHRIYTNVFGAFTIINLTIMVICNIVVITTLLCLRLCRHRCSDAKFCAPHRTSRQRELEMQMVIVLVVITFVFILSWSPMDFRLFLNQLWPHTTQEDHISDLIAVRLTSINQIVDPWVYIICRKVFTTRVWRWVRMPLMGRSWLLRRDSSSMAAGGGGSKKKISRTLTPIEKKIEYKMPPFNQGGGGGGGGGIVGGGRGGEDEAERRGVALVEEVDIRLPSPPTILPPSKANFLGGREAPPPDVQVLRDSGSVSNNTPSTFCSDSVNANWNPSFHGDTPDEGGVLGIVPIPLFSCQQYRVAIPDFGERGGSSGGERQGRRVRRICSSASARAASSGNTGHGPLQEEKNAGTHNGNAAGKVSGRRHSWCCPQDGLLSKQFRTQSTQTFKADENTNNNHTSQIPSQSSPRHHHKIYNHNNNPNTGTHQLAISPQSKHHHSDSSPCYHCTASRHKDHVLNLCENEMPHYRSEYTQCNQTDQLEPWNQHLHIMSPDTDDDPVFVVVSPPVAAGDGGTDKDSSDTFCYGGANSANGDALHSIHCLSDTSVHSSKTEVTCK